MRIGPIVTPLFRRNPAKLARETVSLDHLSGGRMVLGAGLGGDWFGEISTFAGPQEARVRAAMLDESLAIITGLWSGAKFSSTALTTRCATRSPANAGTASANSDLARRDLAEKTAVSPRGAL